LEISEEAILQLHRQTRGKIWAAGNYKNKDSDIIERYPDGRSRVRFKTVTAAKTPDYMRELVVLYNDFVLEQKIPPLILMAAFNLDFLCIHPFRDGNGRVSRLLLLLQCYHLGFEVGRYVSLARLIEQNKDQYYETLEISSTGWQEREHDPWPYINFILFILKNAYNELQDRLGKLNAPKGEKTRLVLHVIEKSTGPFCIADLQKECPNVSVDLIRRVLKNLKAQDQVECLGRGQQAKWQKTGDWELGNTD
jgi:Fic family protein